MKTPDKFTVGIIFNLGFIRVLKGIKGFIRALVGFLGQFELTLQTLVVIFYKSNESEQL